MKTTRQMWGGYKPLRRLTITAVLLMLTGLSFAQNNLPFTKGVNLCNFLEYWGEQKDALPTMNKYDETDFVCLKSMGVDVIRLVCSFDLYTQEASGIGKIDETILKKLDEVCDWAEKNQIYLIIDNHNNHTFDKLNYTSNDFTLLQKHLESVWSQIAPRYADRSDYIIYEIMNEPTGGNASKWYKIQQEIISLIRRYDTKHSIVVSCIDWSKIPELVKLKPYKDDNLIYTFHCYEPFFFTHQGRQGDPTTERLIDVPFPYDQKRFPKLPDDLSWFREQYRTEGTVKYINSLIKKAADWAKKNNVKVFCGELGPKIWINTEDRISWISTVVNALNENDIPYLTWNIDDSTGFLKNTNVVRGDEKAYGVYFPEDIDEAVAKAYGFNMPSSQAIAMANDSLKKFPQKSYVVYAEADGKRTSVTPFNARITKVSDSHERCFVTSYPQKQANIEIYLPKAITSKFEENEKSLVICFDVKFTDKNQSFEVLLVDSDGGKKELPWTKRYDLKASDYALNKWITVEIPVSRFDNNWGAWSNVDQAWYDLPCEFTWLRFEKLTFNFNDHTGGSSKGDLYIDSIVIKQK